MKTIVSEKGQITIPKGIRNKLGLTPGTVLEMRTEDGKLIGTKTLSVDIINKWRGRGALPGNKNTDDYIREIRE